ncbi:hypothetical protein GOP47_0016292 [Adiantum capillus-veneris]|uniref:Vacuolar protein sorting-associated protein 51 homolog n=1 Tax=Adiantum capillus-veneris TaxID=13818 RepID=A0A9D4UHU6_ADICA|nr:hypothetical protein GOP47_0016292 [Adiantum capillus-veneris]
MAEDLQSKTKRVRDLLSSFYGEDEEHAQSSPTLARRDTLQAINTKAFDADRYMSSLVHRTNLEGLLQKHVEMAAEIKNLDSDMQMLVYENYNKFISATDTIRRMKENIMGMESNVEQLLEKVTAVRTKSDGVNASLFERRERIEELNGTRGLLRKVQFVFDLPKRLRKCLKTEAYTDAVRFYKGALPVLKAYGRTSFQTCKEDSDEVMGTITRRLQARATADTESMLNRAEAVRLLQELNFPVDKIMEKYLAGELERLSTALKGVAQLSSGGVSAKRENESEQRSPRSTLEALNKEFLADFRRSASTFRAVFPMGEKRFADVAIHLFKKYLASVQKSVDPDFGDSSAKELIAALKILSTDVAQMDDILPDAGLSELALQAAEASVRQHVTRRFKGLFDRLMGVLTVANSIQAGKVEGELADDKKPLESLLINSQDIILQGSLDVLRDLKELLDDRVKLMINWSSLYVDLVQGGLQELFVMLNNHFLAMCSSTIHEISKQDKLTEESKKKIPVSSGLILLLARISVYIEQMAVPKITEEIATSFIGGGTRGPEDRPAFVPTEICRLFRATGERLLEHYISIQSKKLSMLIKKSVTTPNWLKYKEPREVRMFVDLLLQEVECMSREVKQLLDPGTVRTHRRSDSTGSAGSSRSNPLREERSSRTSISQRARSRLLERDVAKLFKQKIEVFTKLEFTQTSVISAVIKMCLKSFQEYVRLETFSRSGFQQIQVDTQYLREALREVVDDEAIVHFLLDEVCSAAAERCLDAIPFELAILDKLVQAKRAKRAESSGS